MPIQPITQRGMFGRDFTKSTVGELFVGQNIVGSSGYSKQIIPGDTVAVGSMTIQNVVAGSRYWIAQYSDQTNVIASGTAAGGDINLTGIAMKSSPMQVLIRVRKLGYIPFETVGFVTRSGGSVYVIQTQDTIESI